MGATEEGLGPSHRAIVLGASGFIGRWVTRSLARRRVRIWCPVRDTTTAKATFARFGIETEPTELDLLDSGGVIRLLRDVRPHVVYNLAGYGVDQRERDEDLAEAINVDLVRLLVSELPSAREQGWSGQALIHTGSALEYGAVGGDLREETEPNATTSYGRTKLEGTRLVAAAAAESKLPGVVARLFTVYGPGEHPGRLVPTLIGAARNSARIPLTMGTQQRDFTYVEDVIEGLDRLVAAAPAHAVMNLCTGRLTTVRTFIETAAEVLAIEPDRLGFGEVPTRAEEMQHQAVSNARLRATLGWQPSTSIRAGILATAKFEGIANAVG